MNKKMLYLLLGISYLYCDEGTVSLEQSPVLVTEPSSEIMMNNAPILVSESSSEITINQAANNAEILVSEPPSAILMNKEVDNTAILVNELPSEIMMRKEVDNTVILVSEPPSEILMGNEADPGEIAGMFGNWGTNDDKTSSKKRKKGKTNQAEPVKGFCHTRNGGGIGAEFLWWSTNYNFPFSVNVLSSIQIPGPTSDLVTSNTFSETDTKVGRIEKKWSPGFRINAAYFPDYEDLDLQVIWTYYFNKPKSQFIGAGTILIASFFEADAVFRLLYNVGDLELGKSYFLTSKVKLRPFCGVRAAWLKQLYKADFFGTTDVSVDSGGVSETLTFDTPLVLHISQDIWSVGPRIGLNTSWFRLSGLSIMGNISASLLYGRLLTKLFFDNVSASNDNNSSGGNQTASLSETDFNATDRYFQLFPTLQLLLGASWEQCIGRNSSVKIYAGWETNFLWQTSSILYFDRGISMQGLTAGASYNF